MHLYLYCFCVAVWGGHRFPVCIRISAQVGVYGTSWGDVVCDEERAAGNTFIASVSVDSEAVATAAMEAAGANRLSPQVVLLRWLSLLFSPASWLAQFSNVVLNITGLIQLTYSPPMAVLWTDDSISFLRHGHRLMLGFCLCMYRLLSGSGLRLFFH